MTDQEEVRAKYESSVLAEVAASKALELRKDTIGIAQLLVGTEHEDTLAALRRRDPELWARFHYFLSLRDAAYRMDDRGRFVFPDPAPVIEARALLMKRSVGARIVEALKSISHITEGAPQQRRGLLGRH